MTPLVASVTSVAAFLTVLADIGLVWLVAACAARGLRGPAFAWIGRHGTKLALGTACLGLAGSLFYSDIAGFAMCVLCVFQRALLGPLAAFLGAALLHPRRIYRDAALVFAVAGASVAAYNQYLQFGGVAAIPCGADGAACARRFFVEFGYVTIPMMAFTCFALVAGMLVAEWIIHRAVR